MVILRTFIAIELSPEVIAELTHRQNKLKRAVSLSIAWAAPKGSHLTLKFLGTPRKSAWRPSTQA